eukprot:TRINITY_DN67432_c0_g1_i1.p1 TRINITY_DN67432_c0_g1~~TRINITY_DN67432_c0_g1_i1.p1  ORF type:complete len:283 (-),score=60.70 TRINITY_DN67432_c0_g1_i1:48-896(-)
MGAGALAAELHKANQDEVRSYLTGLSAEDHAKVLTALALVESDGALGKEKHAEKAEETADEIPSVVPVDPGKFKGHISLTEVADTVIGNLISGEPVLRLPRAACELGLRTEIAKALQVELGRVLLFQDGEKLGNDSPLDFKSIVVQVLPAVLWPALRINVSDSYEEYSYYTGWSYSLLVKPTALGQLDEARAERIRIHEKSRCESSCSEFRELDSGTILDRLQEGSCGRKLMEDSQFARLQEIIHQAGSGIGFNWDFGDHDGYFIEVAGHLIAYSFSSFDDG